MHRLMIGTMEIHKLILGSDNTTIGITLESMIRSADYLHGIRKSEICTGDLVFVKTIKSIYRLRALGEGLFEVSGGWFDKKGISPARMRISGCTWGGSTIQIDLIAACGLRIEFANRLVTSTIQKIFVLPHGCEN